MIKFNKVNKKYKSTAIIKDLSFTLDDGKLISIIGESGCGKTTTLKMINRLIEPTSGEITIHGKDIKTINEIKLRRKIGYVIQQTGLFPHMTIRDNIEIIAKLEKMPKEKRIQRVSELMEMVDLKEELLDRYPNELSGGQLQRVGIARAFMTNPDIILMDEPFSALDPMSREALQDELLKIQEKEKKTIVFVTHDMDEAIKLSDKIAIMDQGRLVQYDTPEMILKHPATELVKKFVGKKRIWSSPELIKVKDIMIEHPVTCRKTNSIFYCLNKMRMNKVDSLMVTTEEKKLEGILYAATFTNEKYNMKKAKDFMEEDYLSVHPEDSIVDLAKLVSDIKTATIPVVDNNNILCGLITRSSLVTALSQQFIEEEE